MPGISHEELIAQLAEAGDNLTLSLRQVMVGAMEAAGGPKDFGKMIGTLMIDPALPMNSRVSLINNYMKLLGQNSEKPVDEEFTAEQIASQLRDLGDDDGPE
jgi:hypothetical protein